MFHILLNTVGNSSIAYHPEVKATDKIVLNLIRYNWFLKFALLNIHFAEKWQLTVGPFKCKFKLHVYIGAAIPPNSTVVNSENHIWYLIVSLDEEKHGMGCINGPNSNYSVTCSVLALPFKYLSKPVGTWKYPITFNRIPREEAIYRTLTWLDLYEICCLYDFYSVRIMFSRCKDVLQSIVISLKILRFFDWNKPIPHNWQLRRTITSNHWENSMWEVSKSNAIILREVIKNKWLNQVKWCWWYQVKLHLLL